MPYLKDLELHTIELKKFIDTTKERKEELENMILKVKDALALWTAFLIRYDLINTKKLPKGVDGLSVEKAIGVIEVMNFTEEEREVYEGRLKWLRMQASSLKKAEMEGDARGVARGEARAEARGIQKGVDIRNIDIAKNMLQKGYEIKLIKDITELPQQTIEQLKKEL